ncbi:MAG TPA: FHA domain-containing protein [Roseiflexaceae bacterium]|nr:FHA domain-containing protein [Roseiflexaceae bacterium]
MARTSPGVLERRGAGSAPERIVLSDITTLGRASSCVVVISAPTISRLHASIELRHDRYVIFDTGSANGTFVNGERVDAAGRVLSTGDVISLGSDEVAFTFADPEQTLISADVRPAALYIDDAARVVKVYGVVAQLSPLEYDLLLHLASHPGTVCTREGSYLAVWGQPYNQATCEDALNACIAKLRRNLRVAAEAAGQEPPIITTIQRVGFRLDSAVAFAPRADAITQPDLKARSV